MITLPPDRETSATPLRQLAPQLAALQTLRRGLGMAEPEDDAAPGIRRLVRAIRDSAALEGFPDVRTTAAAVERTDRAELDDAVDLLIGQLAQLMDHTSPREPETILIIEDDTLFATHLEAALSGPDRRIVVAATAAAARQALGEHQIRLVVLDLILPDGDGRTLLHDLRSDPRTAGVPVYVVSARFGTRTKAECFALGADAYHEKPLDLEAFRVAVTSRLCRLHDQARQARRDPVTGLPNRAAFLESAALLRGAAAPDTHFSLAMLDLDHFHWVEATWGRRFGEAVLRRVGVRLAMALRQAALFARWDGAEFIALFRDRGAGETAAIIDQALAMLRRLEFRTGGDTPLTVTFSAGVVDVDPPRSMDDTIELADRLRYLAKASGRNRVASGGARLESSPARILLAEDDPDIVRVLTTHLGREGFEILACADGRQALREAPGCGASLIISDIEMPELDGLEFLKAIRSHPELRHLPVMMLTAMGDEAVIVRAFELGADDYVLKPFSLRELAARLRRLLRRPCLAGVPAA